MFPVSPRAALRRALGLVTLAAACCALVLGSAASAQSPTTLAFKELNKGSTFAFVDQAPLSKAKGEPSPSAGDLIVFTNPLTDATGKRIGRLYMHCAAVVAARRAADAAYACENASRPSLRVPSGSISPTHASIASVAFSAIFENAAGLSSVSRTGAASSSCERLATTPKTAPNLREQPPSRRG